MILKQKKSAMQGSNKANFSQRPSYNAGVVDAVFSKYCTISTVNAEKDIRKGGIDVTERRKAILKSLTATSKPHIFGELEMGLINN